MRKNFGPKPYLFPMPVLIVASYDENGIPNAMNVAWGCMADTNRIAMYVAAEHKSTKNILARKAFTVSMADAAHVAEADYVGIVSGNKTPNKMEKAGFHTTKSTFVDAPLIEELPMALECKLVSFDHETELMIGEIINVSCSEEILTEGKVDVIKLGPISFDPINHTYLKTGSFAGNAFSDGLSLKKE